MDDTGDFEILEKRELRSNKRSHFNKRSARKGEEGYVVKKVIARGFHRPAELVERVQNVADRLPDDRCGDEWNNDVWLSLKKKSRWALLDELRSNIEAWNEHYDDDDVDGAPGNFTVSALEKRISWTQQKPHAAKCQAYHAMEPEEDGDGSLAPVHRFPKHRYGNESTLTQKPKAARKPKKATRIRRLVNDRRPVAPHADAEENEQGDGERTARLRYEITTVQDLERFKNRDSACHCRACRLITDRRRNRCAVGKYLISEDPLFDDDVGMDFEEPEDEIAAPSRMERVQEADGATADLVEETSADLILDAGQLQMVDHADQSELVERNDGNSLVNLIDLAFLQSGRRTEPRSQKRRRQRHRRHGDASFSSSSWPGDTEVDSPAGTSGVTGVTASVSDQNAAKTAISTADILSDAYFEMIPTSAVAITDSLSEDYLLRTYGEAYYECSCIPRRFVIDVSGNVEKAFESIYGDRCSHLDIRLICVCEVVPEATRACCVTSKATFDAPATKSVKIWMNGSFARRDIRNICVETINPSSPQTIEQIVDCVVKMATILPFDHYPSKQAAISALDSVYQSPAQLLLKSSLKRLESCTETNEVLEEAKVFKKLQRQITVVARCDRFSNDDGDYICAICLDWGLNDARFCLSQCRHWFCNKCWRSYCVERIFNGWTSIPCPFPRCDSVLDYYTLTTFLPLDICRRYSQQVRDQSIMRTAKNWTWCPNPKCARLVQLDDEESSLPAAVCVCGHFWCTKCSNASHWPASCGNAKLYIKKLKDRLDDPTLVDAVALGDKKIHAVEVKRCPHCKIFMEKGEGCICMTCRCGELFCWGCGGPWSMANHSRCYSIKMIQGFTRIRLIDVGKELAGELREMFYERSLTHRMATRPPTAGGFKRDMLTKCWNTRKRLQNSMIDTMTKATAVDRVVDSGDSRDQLAEVTNRRLARRMAAVTGHVRRFMDVRHQAHYLLEYFYVHLQYCTRRSWAHLDGVKFSVDRLEFVLGRMEDACKSGDLRKVDEFMQRTDALLRKLVDELRSMTFSETDTRSDEEHRIEL